MAPNLDDNSYCVAKLKTLADVTRFAVVRQLMGGPAHAGALAVALAVEQSLLSHHLRLLREAGLVVARREGKGVLYALAPTVMVVDKAALDLGCCRLSFC